ncbi:Na+/solute symporter, variant 2 [Balamuthia mandrillaris]
MIFMGKWNRRAKVMTMAEWMMLRFGEGKHGNWARVVSAITVLLTTVVMITYFAIGSGKFVGEFLGIPYFLGISPTFWAACLMVGLSMSFTVASGLHGVVWTDVFQSVLILGIIIYVCVAAMVKVTLPDTFLISLPLGSGSDGAFRQLNVTKEEWESVITPSKVWNLGLDSDYSYSIYNYFYLTVTFYSLKVLLDGFGGVSGYMLQRFLSAKNDKEASKLTCLWIFLLSFRWPFIAAVALLGVYYGNVYNPGHVIADPETVLPIVIGELFPVGMKGLLLAGLTAAAISTFDSTVNAAAAYWVKDIYQAFIRPNATPKQLMFHSRVSSVVIVIIGLAVTLITPNINSMWGWVNSGLAGGMLVPLMLRWYWWRLNGMGFAIGTIGGITAGVLQKMVLPDIEEYYALLWSVSVCIGTHILLFCLVISIYIA